MTDPDRFPSDFSITVDRNIIGEAELTQKPIMDNPVLTVGKRAKLSCKSPGNCHESIHRVVWTGIDNGTIKHDAFAVPGLVYESSILFFKPEPEHHKTKLTCTVIFNGNIPTETSVILKVRCTFDFFILYLSIKWYTIGNLSFQCCFFICWLLRHASTLILIPAEHVSGIKGISFAVIHFFSVAPRIRNTSSCSLWGDKLTCMCVSDGFPLADISWPLLDVAADFYSIATSREDYSMSNISISGFSHLNSTVKCISKNELGEAQMEIPVNSFSETHKGRQNTFIVFVSWGKMTVTL
ncbi:uncharacterized protein [Misgurnus anguillicaudatus]|uniref:uncharacterized protein n=1 Tax=Misgurnus anguillicaudatus TaxID=75329 RepID=UPI003CCFDF94